MTGSLAARLDACPKCLINTEVPYGSFETPAGGLVALYQCTDCGHRWHTSWATEEVA
jgi:DNA-directed RNA polymerase subunit M/transcription elongation factor TFIIS